MPDVQRLSAIDNAWRRDSPESLTDSDGNACEQSNGEKCETDTHVGCSSGLCVCVCSVSIHCKDHQSKRLQGSGLPPLREKAARLNSLSHDTMAASHWITHK